MHKFKVGDKVEYIKHSDPVDLDYFTIKKVYTITKIDEAEDYYLNDVGVFVSKEQIKLYKNPCEKILQDILDA